MCNACARNGFAHELIESTMNALLDALDCGFFRNPRGLFTVDLIGGACAPTNSLARVMQDNVS